MPLTSQNFSDVRPLQTAKRGWIADIQWSPDGRLLACASAGGVGIWRGSLTPKQAFIKGHDGPVKRISFDHTGRRLATASADTTVKTWDLTAYSPAIKPSANYTASQNALEALVYLPSGGLLSGDADGRLWQLIPDNAETLLLEVDGEINTVALQPGQSIAALSGTGGFICLINTETGEEITRWPAHADRTRQIVFHPTEPHLYSAGRDGYVYVWDFSSTDAPQQHTSYDLNADVRAMALSQDGSLLAAGAGDTIHVIDTSTHKTIVTLHEHKKPVVALAFHPANHFLVSGGGDNRVILWGIETPNVVE